MPCKEGDTVWYLTGNPSLSSRPNFNRVESERVAGVHWDSRGLQIQLRNYHGNHGTYGYFGKSIFLTREEAEEALRGGRWMIVTVTEPPVIYGGTTPAILHIVLVIPVLIE